MTGQAETISSALVKSFPPDGWVTNREAARRLGVKLDTLTAIAWKWREMVRGQNRCVRHPNGGRCNIYPVAVIEAILKARAEWEKRQIPEGFVDKEGACRMFKINRCVWKNWIREGKVRCGERLPGPRHARVMVYRVEDIERLRDELFGEDKLYKDGKSGRYHVPADLVTREEAWETFGVNKPVWERWEREGKITCGQRVPGGPKLYRVEDINRMLDEYGKWAPPYPDPDRPGVYRVPLSGRDIKRREAIIDADALPLIEECSCNWSTRDDGDGFVGVSSPGENKGPLRRMVMGITSRKFNVRHVNGDALDCRRENLVVRTIKQRSRNARKMKSINGRPPTSRFKGVYWEKAKEKWRARISADAKVYWLGRFRDEIAAAEAYDEAARELFGEHAWLNFPDGVDAWLESEQRREAA
jgi:AP2 domain